MLALLAPGQQAASAAGPTEVRVSVPPGSISGVVSYGYYTAPPGRKIAGYNRGRSILRRCPFHRLRDERG